MGYPNCGGLTCERRRTKVGFISIVAQKDQMSSSLDSAISFNLYATDTVRLAVNMASTSSMIDERYLKTKMPMQRVGQGGAKSFPVSIG